VIRVLVVDDSHTQRLLIRAIIENDPELSVAGEARSGEAAIDLCMRYKPDIVTMDINMPGIGGYEAIRQIMSESPCPVIVLTSIETDQLMKVSFKALGLGALAVVPKPFGLPSQDAKARNLVSQLKIMSVVKVIRRPLMLQSQDTQFSPHSLPSAPFKKAVLPGHQTMPRLVAIGVSTGGPPALQVILSGLPSGFSLPILIVQHISRGFVGGLAGWLSESTPFLCTTPTQGEELQPGRVYLAPDDAHLKVRPPGLAWLDPSEPVRGLRPAVTPLFESVAQAYGPAAVGVLLTGMGEDGATGLLAMHRSGAYTIAQDEASSVVFGMPKAAVDLGAVDEILALEQVAPRLRSLAGLQEA
jgi:two-component system, chemotaxis family, protein-glutamate methylesterase/glutaminase